MDIVFWMQEFIRQMQHTFGDRVIFIGLQGSYARGEATSQSDIDIVLLLNNLSIKDLQRYKQAVGGLPYREKLCGFVGDKSRLLHWDKADLFQFYHDTVPYYGSIAYLAALIQPHDVKRAIQTGACNLYHACSHNFLHENDPLTLIALYKNAVFVLQAKHYYETGVYIKAKPALLQALKQEDKAVLSTYLSFKKSNSLDADEWIRCSEVLFTWAANLVEQFGA